MLSGAFSASLKGFMAAFEYGDGARTHLTVNISAENRMIAAGTAMTVVGSTMGLAAIALGSCGAVRVKRAIRNYNSANDLQIRLAVTPGGVGMQLYF